MISFHSKSYHHPRWPLVKNTISCTLWFLIGMGILVSPVGHFRWIGLVPFSYGLGCWFSSIQPRWKHIIRIDTENLMIDSLTYPWDSFDQLKIERKESGRSIRLAGHIGTPEVIIKDDLPGFEELAQQCFFYLNQPKRKTETTSNNPYQTSETTRN